ncbi:MAG: hypothetical protein KGL95_13050 [Patescibacteria group bacterium]|nr:hypothetical protein [Patescibacteria group bacterium]
MSFSSITSDLRKELVSNMPQIRILLKKNPAMAFTTINEIASKIGGRNGITLSLNFPQRGKIEDFESYGTENIGMVFQRNSRSFPIDRNLIKSKAGEILDRPQVHDAYMYEGKEGVRVVLENMRLDILPASLHVWGKFDDRVKEFCNWLLINCYQLNPGVDGALSETNSKT